MTEALDMPAGFDLPAKLKPTKRKALKWIGIPVAGMGLLCTIDVQTMNQQKPAACESAQQPVTVPKTHIWLAGSITSVLDTPAPLRDVMAGSHPEVALTQVIAANPTLSLSPMGNIPPMYGGRACLTIPGATTAPAAGKTPAAKAVVPGKAQP